MPASIDKFIAQANAVELTFRRQASEFEASPMHSAEGKAFHINQLRQKRDGQLAELRQRAEAQLTQQRIAAQAAVVAANEKRVQAQRALLGDQVLADIMRTQLTGLDARGIWASYESAGTAWEKSIIAGYGRALLLGQRSADAFEALQQIDYAERTRDEFAGAVAGAQQDLNAVTAAEAQLEQLDPAAYVSTMAGAYGLSPQAVADVVLAPAPSPA